MFIRLLIYVGAALMVVNIVRYWRFMSASHGVYKAEPRLLAWRTVGLVLLVFFLVGYIISALMEDPGIILSLVLFFGSVFVALVLTLIAKLVGTSERMVEDVEDILNEVDPKTGIYNLRGFSRHAADYLRTHPNDNLMVVQWDLDQFKVYNDLFGYQAGDDLLRAIGDLSPKRIVNARVLGHLESDHFVVLAPCSNGAANEIYRAVQGIVEEASGQFSLGVHMGLCPVDDKDDNIASLCDHALIALRSTKGPGGDRFAWYQPSMRDDILEDMQLVRDVDQALESGQFRPWFQPQIDYATGKIIGAEALVRWHHPTRGLVPPYQFIPLFERNGLITKLDHHVWEQVCQFQRAWIDEGHTPLPVSVNVSRKDAYRDDLAATVSNLVDAYDLDHGLLNLEITESAYMINPDKLNALVDELQANGFKVEIDDFGSGYSSLNTLKDMKADTLKLDMKFLQHTNNSQRANTIVSAMVNLAGQLSMETIAEGVETREQADFLKSLGCFNLQGFFFHRPIPADDYRKLLLGE